MNNKKIIYIFFGTTAELIKLIPVINELGKRKTEYRIVLSGQTGINFKEFEALIGKQEIYFKFENKTKNPSPALFVFWSIKTLINSIIWSRKEFSGKERKDYIFLVQGDTVTASIGAIASNFAGIKLAHIEAGLRSHNIFEPFPEEVCRNVVSYFSNINFCPNKKAYANLKNRKGKKVDTRWNTSVEAFDLATKLKNDSKNKNEVINKPYFIFILHRQEHMYLRKKKTKKLISSVIRHANKDLRCLFIAHDVTKSYLANIGLWSKIERNKNIQIVKHLPYLDFVHVLEDAKFIATDGGGNHTESHYLGLPCLILRKRIEQTEGLGENVVLSYENPKIIEDFFENTDKYKYKKKNISTRPSKVIVDSLLKIK